MNILPRSSRPFGEEKSLVFAKASISTRTVQSIMYYLDMKLFLAVTPGYWNKQHMLYQRCDFHMRLFNQLCKDTSFTKILFENVSIY